MLQPVLSQCGALQVWVHIEPPERSWERAVSHHFHPARELERKSYTQANYGGVLGGCYVIFQRQWNGVGLEFQWAHWLKQSLFCTPGLGPSVVEQAPSMLEKVLWQRRSLQHAGTCLLHLWGDSVPFIG
ncbi:uncharacterized protein LOC132686173 isoform X2 [Panthera onca]